jgi:lipopolysaccharide transport system permease protein
MSYVNDQYGRLPGAIRYLAALIAYRHLCWNLVGSNLRARFRRSHLGILWALLQPLAVAMMIAAVWGGLHQKATFWEFAAYIFTGFVVFELFSNSFQTGQDSLASASGFVRQARIPFLIFQVRTVLTALVVFLVALPGALLVAGVVTGGANIGPQLVLVPAFLGVAFFFMLPIVITMSIVGAMFRDVRHISQLVERALFLMSPVMLPREILEQPQLRFLEFVNPLVSFIDMFRDPILYGKFWNTQDMIVISIWIAIFWVVAIYAATSVGRKIVFAL